jgi:monovalent cation:H+ antiporter-2, CPA2 family
MSAGHFIQDFLLLLVALVVFGPLFQRLMLGSILGYLVAGVVIGPSLLGLIDDPERTRAVAELGVVFLLFAIGLQLRWERLRVFKPGVYALAVAQITVTAAAIGWVTAVFGFAWAPSMVVGGALALSSTALVIELLGELGRVTSRLGRTAIAILLVQDVAVGPLMVFVHALGGEPGSAASALAMAALKSLLMIAFVVLVARTALPTVLRLAASAKGTEVFAAVALLLVLGTGWLAEQMGLSMAIGAFLAGLMVADTRYRHQIAADIQPFRGMLLGFFFMTVGMTVDLGVLAANAGTVALLVAALVAGKGGLLALLALAFRLPVPRAIGLGGVLSQGGEFGFVVFGIATSMGILDAHTAQILVVTVALSMMTTPIIALAGRQLLEKAGALGSLSLGNLPREAEHADGHVVIAGFGQVGKAVARYLLALQIPILVLDLTPGRVTRSRTRGLKVFYGDASRLDVLRAAKLDQASSMIITVSDAKSTLRITELAHRSFPGLRIFARVPHKEDAHHICEAGAHAVAVEGLTTAMDLAERVMLIYEPKEEADLQEEQGETLPEAGDPS